MTKPTSTIHMLWKGKLFGTCTVSIFTSKQTPEDIRYDIQDTTDIKHMLHESGIVDVVGTNNIDTIIAVVHGYIERRYIALTLQMYTKEIRNGYKH